MKKRVLIILGLICLTKLWCLENFQFKIVPEFGLMNGHINEYVFSNQCKNTDNMVSKLNWDVKNVPYFELTASVDIFKYVFACADFKTAIPCTSGNMQDYDWLNSLGGSSGIPSSWKYDPATELTNYSCHTNKLVNYFDFNLAIGGNIRFLERYCATPFLAWNYKYFTFDGFNGWRDYKEENHTIQKISGKVISYQQEQNAFMLGVNFNARFTDEFTSFFQLMICPGIGSFNALDTHYSRRTAFLDKLDNYFELKSKIAASYAFNPYATFGITFALDYLPLKKGPDYNRSTDADGKLLTHSAWSKSSAQGGSDAFIWSLALNYIFTF